MHPPLCPLSGQCLGPSGLVTWGVHNNKNNGSPEKSPLPDHQHHASHYALLWHDLMVSRSGLILTYLKSRYCEMV